MNKTVNIQQTNGVYLGNKNTRASIWYARKGLSHARGEGFRKSQSVKR